jgi:hypothetical protein
MMKSLMTKNMEQHHQRRGDAAQELDRENRTGLTQKKWSYIEPA